VKLYNSVLDWSCCSLFHHLVPASTDNASRSPTLVGRTLPRRFRGSKFGSGVDLTQSGCSTSWRRDPTPLTNSLYLVAALNLHALSIKFILSYQLPWHPIFWSHHRSRLCISESSIFSQWPSAHVVSFTVYLKKKSKIFRVYLVRLLPLARLVWLSHLARQSKASFDESVCFILALLTL
jgi:hypothetical protein